MLLIDIQRIIDSFHRCLEATSSLVERYLYDRINWDERVVAVVGARGVGKTTLLLQRILKEFGETGDGAVYISFDNIWTDKDNLMLGVGYFYRQGIRHVFFDEVHRCPNWSQLLKGICGLYPDLNIVYAGLPLFDYEACDVNQVVYGLYGLSFREYLADWRDRPLALDPIGLEDLLKGREEYGRKLRREVHSAFKEDIDDVFKEYLNHGFYPFGEDNLIQVDENARLSMECDIPAFEGISPASVRKMERLFWSISRSAPLYPNVSYLAKEIGATRAQTLRMLNLLEKVGMIRLLRRPDTVPAGKPELVYLANHDLLSVFGNMATKTRCSTFFASQVGAVASLEKPRTGADFLVDGKWSFVMGEYDSLTRRRRKDIPPDCFFVTSGGRPIGDNEIPIWLFGFLY